MKAETITASADAAAMARKMRVSSALSSSLWVDVLYAVSDIYDLNEARDFTCEFAELSSWAAMSDKLQFPRQASLDADERRRTQIRYQMSTGTSYLFLTCVFLRSSAAEIRNPLPEH